ncbi:MAG: beta-galactosidase, partial [Clostridia bacterium]|nr:beta-galactosidase [Clostridia bacterium]
MVHRYHENPEKLHIGTLDNRAYYIPFSNRSDALSKPWQASDRVLLLSGTWDFAYFPSYEAVPEQIEYDATIPVPSVWQNHGYGRHQYTNIKLPIPYDPPYVPLDNPCGVYRKRFALDKRPGAVYCVNFEGVDSCYYVTVNGEFAGFSQVSHSTSEFDVTALLKDGENEIVVQVLQWCFGTYLEDQDKFRMSGIFRDVYLIERPARRVHDFFVRTGVTGDQATVSVDLSFLGGEVPANVTLLSPDGAQIESKPHRAG